MSFIILGFAIFAGAGIAGAQTLYNSPGQQQTDTQRGPLNLKQLFQRNRPADAAAEKKTSSYANLGAHDNGFTRRAQQLAEARALRDQQAWADQQRSLEYMAALAQSDDPRTFGVPPGQVQQNADGTYTPLATQPGVPLIYQKPKAGLEKPRPLFNSVQ